MSTSTASVDGSLVTDPPEALIERRNDFCGLRFSVLNSTLNAANADKQAKRLAIQGTAAIHERRHYMFTHAVCAVATSAMARLDGRRHGA